MTIATRVFPLIFLLISLGTAAEEEQRRPEIETNAHLGAVGVGVSDLEKSADFYSQILGLEIIETYELGYVNEIVMGSGNTEGAVLVLMNWPNDPDRKYAGNDVKIVFYVDDPAAVIERIRSLGGRIDREATPIDILDGAIVGLARDPDNYVVEVLER